MAERYTDTTLQHTTGIWNDNTNMDHEHNLKETEIVKRQDTGDGGSVNEKVLPKGSSPPPDDGTQDVEQSSTHSQAEDEEETEEETTVKTEISNLTGHKEAPEATGSPTPDGRKADQVDGRIGRIKEESHSVKETNIDAGGDNERVPPHASSEQEISKEEEEETHVKGNAIVNIGPTTLETTEPEVPVEVLAGPEYASPQQGISEEEEEKEEIHEQRNSFENIGPTTPETTEPNVPVVTGNLGGHLMFLIPVVLVLVAAILLHPLQSESPLQTSSVDIFLGQMEKVKAQFPHQHVELWKRSRIHLQRHLQTAQPTAPVSLILTAGLRAERTLHCLARDLASAFSFALNASVLHIDGASKTSQDSDQVKLDLDGKLQGAFEGDKPVAVIHRFEELPPGSTLIFYRYCDHENAAYKGTFLIFTVLLEEEEEIPANIRLSAVEEMVDDHLKKKFLSHGHPVSFDRMDLNKYSGLWSRISHLILPVAAEDRIEHEGCPGV
ncbi:torsin-1A-interacting protein 2 [Scophthalmus maximus]|uniref:torsin-1A-interacting protein 2 n=1 Tax=Scophthalmus maximus TaxID=52904 RepID=UPI001FA8347D|nr:torsin-1A-interacting protein 2 [Scophthalmus maximus]